MKGAPLTLVGPELKGGRCRPGFQPGGQGTQTCHSERYRQPGAHHQRDSLARQPRFATRRPSALTTRRPSCRGWTSSRSAWIFPFAQKRWCNTFAVDNLKMLSDHKDASFGTNYGTLIKELRIESRAIFVLILIYLFGDATYVLLLAHQKLLKPAPSSMNIGASLSLPSAVVNFSQSSSSRLPLRIRCWSKRPTEPIIRIASCVPPISIENTATGNFLYLAQRFQQCLMKMPFYPSKDDQPQ